MGRATDGGTESGAEGSTRSRARGEAELVQLPRRNRRSLTAAASRVTPADSQYSRRLEMPWQNRALFYTDAIGELHYASQFYSRMLQRLRIFPAA